jgi:ABC-type nitrate/sulfonate/bicarbonate transport system permease component
VTTDAAPTSAGSGGAGPRDRRAAAGARALLTGAPLHWLVFGVAVGLWQLLVNVAVPADEEPFFPPPTAIAKRMYEMWLSGPASHAFLTPEATGNIFPSVLRMLGGWGLAAVLGMGLGLFLGRSQRALDYVDPLIQFFRAIPPPALIPLFIIVFKIGVGMRLAVIVFGVIWPILLNSIEGARSVEPLQLDLARVFKVTAARRLRQIILPAAAPKIFAGLRVSLSLSIILMVISEMVGATDGIGLTLFNAKDSFELPDLWGVIVLLGVLGYTFNAVLLRVERRLLAWHRGAQRIDG